MPIKKTENKTQYFTQNNQKTNNSLSFWLKNEVLKAIIKHRLDVRRNTSLDLITVVSILPFLIGCSNFFAKKYPLVIQNNLPLIKKPREILNWTTLDILFKNSKVPANLVKQEQNTFSSIRDSEKNQNNTFWFNNSILLNQNIFLTKLGQIPYLGIIKCGHSGENSFFNKTISLSFKQSSSIFQTQLTNYELYYGNLDELPSYLESFLGIQQTINKTNLGKTTLLDTTNKEQPKSVNYKQKENLSFKGKFQKNWAELQTQLKNTFFSDSVLLEKNNCNSIEANEVNWRNLSFSELESTFLDLLWRFYYQNENLGKSTEFQNSIFKFQLFLEPFQVRKMSGYRYPDMSTLDLEKFLLQKQFFPKTKNFLTIILNNNPLYTQQYSLKNTTLWNSKDFAVTNLFNSEYTENSFLKKIPDSGSVLIHSKPPFNWNLPTEASLPDENFEQTLVSGVYKNSPSFFENAQTPKFVFHEIWEPITFRSWLLVSQIGFAFFSFQILKSFWDIYSRELLLYLLDLIAQTGFIDDQQKKELEILMGQREQGFRVISKTNKKFTDVVGIEKLLPELAETVWFLRNSAKNFSRSNTLPKGMLFVGPPGTGKTLLAQAIAGEAQVPVLTASGSSLIEPGTDGSIKLEMLFQEARRLSPCLVFIDEIDNIAQKREQVMQSPMVDDDDDENEILEAFITPVSRALQIDSSQYSVGSQGGSNFVNPVDSESPLTTESDSLKNSVQQQIFSQQKMRREQLRLLMQLLIELDGIKGRHGVVVIGATNRPEVLDPAVLRPGRFDKLLHIGLPDPQKRLEILKFYGQRLGYDSPIAWDYLAERTDGFSSADLAALMNESCLKAILSQSKHTLETIEHGIDRITTFETQKPYFCLFKTKKEEHFLNINESESRNFKYSLELSRLAYYQAGKIVLSRLLKNHPPMVVAYLWPRINNIRARKISQNLQKYFFHGARRTELEDRVVGCYAGKAAEILFLQNTSISSKNEFQTNSINEKSPETWLTTKKPKQLNLANFSDLGMEDLVFAQKLIWFMVEKWYLYSKKTAIKKATELSDNRNTDELSNEQIQFLQQLTSDFEFLPNNLNLYKIIYPDLYENSTTNEKEALEEHRKHQNILPIAWWQKYIFDELANIDRNFSEWFRIYLYNPQQRVFNIEWLPPETFYHHNRILTNISPVKKSQPSFVSLKKTADSQNQLVDETKNQLVDETKLSTNFDLVSNNSVFSWTDIDESIRDYQTHSLILQSFNKALTLLDLNRELVDRIASELVSSEILRKSEISMLFETFGVKEEFQDYGSENKLKENQMSEEIMSTANSLIRVVDQQTGFHSRRKKAHWIDFSSLQD